MRRILILSMLLLLAVASLSNATTIIINNQDGVNEGLNDNTPVAPVGGNPGTTLGQQRLNVFQKAADIWAGLLPDNVTIVVNAKMDPQTCTTTSAVLGSTSNNGLYANFPGAPIPNTYYVMSEANKLANSDLDGGALNDMNITFNSNLNGQLSCLNGVGWYYGFDGNEGTNTEMLPVILHEMGHGLGFTSSLGASGIEPGTPPNQFPTVFERFMHDNTTNKQWDVMTAAERSASAINPNNVVFTGPCTTAHAPFVLVGPPTMWVNSGAPLAPKYTTGTANFGPATFSVTGNCVLADDGTAPNSDACTALVNGGAILGNIAVIDRGTCTFVAKSLNAQANGAIAVIIVNNAAGAAPGLGGFDASITIPVVSLSQADGTALKTAMLGGPVNVTLGFDNSAPAKAGADALNHVQIYTPNPFQSGSSISHWDVSAYPNLLMEPAINNNLHASTDLTFWAFGDLGWHDSCNNPVPVAISSFNALPSNGGVKLQASFYSTLADAKFVNVYRANGREDFRILSTVNAPEDGKFSFVDQDVTAGGSYRYKIGVIEGDNEYLSAVADVRLPGAKITLAQNVPNPFNPETTIRFSLPSSERVTLNVYSASGALVRTLVDGVQPSGSHSFTWNGVDNRGNAVSSGVYFYRLTAGKFNDTRKMVLLK
jgi:PA domain/FlgD Ig-like domain